MNEQELRDYIKDFTKEEFLKSDIVQDWCPSHFSLIEETNRFCSKAKYCVRCWKLAIYENNLKFKDDNNNNNNNNKAETKDLQDQIESLQAENLALKNILKTITDLNTQTTKQLEMVNSIFNCQSK